MNHEYEAFLPRSDNSLASALPSTFTSIDAILDRIDQRRGELVGELRRSEVARLRVEAAIHDLMGLLDFADTAFEDLEPEGIDEPMLSSWGAANDYSFNDECEADNSEDEDDDPEELSGDEFEDTDQQESWPGGLGDGCEAVGELPRAALA